MNKEAELQIAATIGEHITGKFTDSLTRAVKPLLYKHLLDNHNMSEREALKVSVAACAAIRVVINRLYNPLKNSELTTAII